MFNRFFDSNDFNAQFNNGIRKTIRCEQIVINESDDIKYENSSIFADSIVILGKAKFTNCNINVNHIIAEKTSHTSFINSTIESVSFRQNGFVYFDNSQLISVDIFNLGNIQTQGSNIYLESSESVILENGVRVHAGGNIEVDTPVLTSRAAGENIYFHNQNDPTDRVEFDGINAISTIMKM